jgi:hypothetical protein
MNSNHMTAIRELLISFQVNLIPSIKFNSVSFNRIQALVLILISHKSIIHATKHKNVFIIPGCATKEVSWLIHISFLYPFMLYFWIKRVYTGFNRRKPLIFFCIVTTYHIHVFIIDHNSCMTYSTHFQSAMQDQTIHALIHIQNLVTRTISLIASNYKHSSNFSSIQQSWI